MQQLKTFINKTFAHHIISQKDNDEFKKKVKGWAKYV